MEIIQSLNYLLRSLIVILCVVKNPINDIHIRKHKLKLKQTRLLMLRFRLGWG
jgi:hypothetical protein